MVSIGHPFGSGAVTYEDGTVLSAAAPFKTDRNTLVSLGSLWYEDIRYAVKFIDGLNRGDMPKHDIDFSGRLCTDAGINLLGVSFGGCAAR